MTVVNAVVYVDGRVSGEFADPAVAMAAARGSSGMLWVGLDRPTPAEVGQLAETLGLSQLGVLESLRVHQRSKIETYNGDIFAVLQPAQYDEAAETVRCHEIDVFVGKDFVVTITDNNAVDVVRARAKLEEHPQVLAKGPHAVLWALFETVTRGYRTVLDDIENDIDEIEEQLFDEEPGVSRRIFALQREVIDLHHATEPLGDMLERLQHIIHDTNGRVETSAFREVADRAHYIDGRVRAFRQTLDAALSIHASLVDQRNADQMREMTQFGLEQNDQVKKISSWAAILFAPTLVGTIYGMNFENMPELSWSFGYPVALGLMVATSVTLYLVFKKRGWL